LALFEQVFPLLDPSIRTLLQRLHTAHREHRYRGGSYLAVIHHDCGRYINFLAAHQRLRGYKPLHSIGRSTFETSRIPREWGASLDLVDEIWTPSHQGRRAFLVVWEGLSRQQDRNQLRKRIHVLPPPLPPGIPQTRAPPPTAGAPYRFLSVFKWEGRKNWRGLLRAYWLEFSAKDGALLTVRTKPNGHELAEFRRDLAREVGLEEAGLARLEVLEEPLGSAEMEVTH
jgi:hypothetical protein